VRYNLVREKTARVSRRAVSILVFHDELNSGDSDLPNAAAIYSL